MITPVGDGSEHLFFRLLLIHCFFYSKCPFRVRSTKRKYGAFFVYLNSVQDTLATFYTNRTSVNEKYESVQEHEQEWAVITVPTAIPCPPESSPEYWTDFRVKEHFLAFLNHSHADLVSPLHCLDLDHCFCRFSHLFCCFVLFASLTDYTSFNIPPAPSFLFSPRVLVLFASWTLFCL